MCVSSMILQEIVAAIFIAVGLALRIFAQCKKKNWPTITVFVLLSVLQRQS